MEIKLDFDENEIDMLYHTRSWSIVAKHENRFSDLEQGNLAKIVKYEKVNGSDWGVWVPEPFRA